MLIKGVWFVSDGGKDGARAERSGKGCRELETKKGRHKGVCVSWGRIERRGLST